MKKFFNRYRKSFRPLLAACCALPLCGQTAFAQATALTEDADAQKLILTENTDAQKTVLVEDADTQKTILVEDADTQKTVLVEDADAQKTVLVEDADTQKTVLVKDADTQELVLVEEAPARDCLFLDADTLKTISRFASYSPEDLALRKELLRLRIRCGDDFTFARKLPLREAQHTLSERFPLPQTVKNAAALEQKLTALTESYSGAWSVYVKNLTTEETILINDSPMKSASVMKLFILGTVLEAIDRETLPLTEEVRDLFTRMICDSSNEASNRLLSLLGDGSYAAGIAKVNEYIQSHGYSSQTHEYNGFESSEAICDPEHFNQVSARDVGRLLELVYHREFGSRQLCNEVENLMLNQHTRYKIPAGLPEDTEVGNKTGEMDTVENDAAIIYCDTCDYILCILSDGWDNKDQAIGHIQELSETVYGFFGDPAYYRPDNYALLAQTIAAEQAMRYTLVEYIDSEPTEENAEETVQETAQEEAGYVLVYDGVSLYLSEDGLTAIQIAPSGASDTENPVSALLGEENGSDSGLQDQNRSDTASSNGISDSAVSGKAFSSQEGASVPDQTTSPIQDAFPLLDDPGSDEGR